MREPVDPPRADAPASAAPPIAGREVTRLRDLSPQQWKSGIAAWLGWLFDGLDMHLYTLVATPFVAAAARRRDQTDPSVGYYGSVIQAAFLVGWALGGGFFGRIGDRLGRARALMLTILTYAAVHRPVVLRPDLVAPADLPLPGGAWGSAANGPWGRRCLSETWPRRWRPWIAAVLQSAVNMRRAAGHGGRLCLHRRRLCHHTATCSWWASCRRCWCSGFAAPCPSRRSGTRPSCARPTPSRASSTCSAARCAAPRC